MTFNANEVQAMFCLIDQTNLLVMIRFLIIKVYKDCNCDCSRTDPENAEQSGQRNCGVVQPTCKPLPPKKNP